MNERKPDSEPEHPVDAARADDERKRLSALARALDTILNGKGTPPAERKTGFCLMLIELPDCERITYIGTVPHALASEVMRVQRAHFEAEAAGGKVAGSETDDPIKR